MPAMGLGTFGYGTAAGGGEWWNDTVCSACVCRHRRLLICAHPVWTTDGRSGGEGVDQTRRSTAGWGAIVQDTSWCGAGHRSIYCRRRRHSKGPCEFSMPTPVTRRLEAYPKLVRQFVTSKTDVGTPRAPGSGGDLPSHLTNDTGYEYTLFQGQQILEITGLE